MVCHDTIVGKSLLVMFYVLFQTISVGSSYQAVVPEGLCKYGDAPAYENEDRLLWDPTKMDDSEGRLVISLIEHKIFKDEILCLLIAVHFYKYLYLVELYQTSQK